MFGRIYANDLGIRPFGVPITLGRLAALASSPLMAAIYFLMRLPRFPFVLIGFKNWFCWHYRLTNRRLIMENPYRRGEIKSVALDRFDKVEIDVLPGQAWYDAGDLIFRLGNTETFRLAGVSRPEAFRSQIIKAHMAYLGVKKALERELAHA